MCSGRGDECARKSEAILRLAVSRRQYRDVCEKV